MLHWGHWLDAGVSAVLLALSRPGERPRPNRRELAYYDRPALLQDPTPLYRFPDEPPDLHWTAGRADSVSRTLPWGERRAFSFPSPFASSDPAYALNPAYAGRYAQYTENHTAVGTLYRPARPPRGTILYLHGWLSASFRLEERLLFPRLVQESGLQVLALTLPFHMVRRPAASGCSGEFFISADLTRTLEAFRQAVAEARSLLAWLRREMPGPVGLAGFSGGALVAALLLGGGARPDFAFLALTPADVVRTLEQARLLRRVRQDIYSAGFAREELDHWARLLSPMALSPVLPPQRLLLLHGQYDAIALPQGVQALWEAWGRPEIEWYPESHFSILLRRRALLQRCQSFLEERLADQGDA